MHNGRTRREPLRGRAAESRACVRQAWQGGRLNTAQHAFGGAHGGRPHRYQSEGSVHTKMALRTRGEGAYQLSPASNTQATHTSSAADLLLAAGTTGQQRGSRRPLRCTTKACRCWACCRQRLAQPPHLMGCCGEPYLSSRVYTGRSPPGNRPWSSLWGTGGAWGFVKGCRVSRLGGRARWEAVPSPAPSESGPELHCGLQASVWAEACCGFPCSLLRPRALGRALTGRAPPPACAAPAGWG